MHQLEARVNSLKEVTARGKKACLPNLSSFNTSTVSGSEEEKRQNPNFSLTFDLQSIYQQIEKVFYNKLLKCAGCGAEGKHIQGYCWKKACVEKRDMTIGNKRQRITCLGCGEGGRLLLGYCNRKRECTDKRYSADVGNPKGKCSLCGSTQPRSRGHCTNRECVRNYTHEQNLKNEYKDSDNVKIRNEIEGDFSEEMQRSKVAKND